MQSPSDDAISLEITKLQKPLAGRRVLSWLFFIVLISSCLIVPVIANVWPSVFNNTGLLNYFGKARSQLKQNPTQKNPIQMQSTFSNIDVMWNPGQLSTVHQPWVAECKVCHSTPFVRVQDADCLACHKNIGEHIGKALANNSALSEVRCATCHREHKGQFGLAEQNKHYVGQECGACHAHIKSVYPEAKTEDVSDFALLHPEFRIQLVAGATNAALSRQRNNGALMEATSLKFPHDVHLAAGGVNGPEGKKVLQCASCHQPNSDGAGFKTVTMKDNCQHCHALNFELAVPNREVPHGSSEEVMSTLREFYSYVSISGVPADRIPEDKSITIARPGEPAVQAFMHGAGDVRGRAIAAATQLFEKTSCVVCHEVRRLSKRGTPGTPGQDMPQWKIAPVTHEHAWMPEAMFSHNKHGSVPCSDCHNAAQSKQAGDVLMPSIKQCRECHSGHQRVVNKVISDCGLCHGFHNAVASQKVALSKSDGVSAVTGGEKK